jgi:hypothetical protein
MTIDFFNASRIESAIERLDELLATGILIRPTNENHLFVESVFTEALILLRDLMYKSERYAQRISFSDHVIKTDKVSDVTDLIKYMRDAICHRESDNHFLDKDRGWSISFCAIRGKGLLGQYGDRIVESEFSDDICYFFGEQRIYLHRHLIRAFNEAKALLVPIVG